MKKSAPRKPSIARDTEQAGEIRVPGFRFAGVNCGIKRSALDLALLVSDVPASVAGVFTRSSVVGAPIDWCRAQLRGGVARGIVVNSGVSNVAMGERGRRDAAAMAAAVAKACGCAPEQVFVASTGVIGEPLPMQKLRAGIRAAHESLGEDGLGVAAEAIRTTDTFAKVAERRVRVNGHDVTIAGIAKGSGMIEPNMATMLGFLVTDAAVSPRLLQQVLKRVVDSSFNRVTVDGESSTSDMVLLLANGLAGHPPLRSARSPGLAAFEQAVGEVSETLAQMLARDGEGATKLVTVDVTGAKSDAEAELTARRIANSLLVKTAIFGRDPNWGRIVQTVGAGRVKLDLEKMEVKLCGVAVFRRGASAGPAARKKVEARLASEVDVRIEVDLAAGRGAARVWTCDLSYDYVRINAEYTT